MNILVIGGTGFIGDQAVRMLLEQGHRVKALALPELPVDYEQPEGLELIQNDISGLSEDALAAILVGCDSLVYAAGIDERVDGKAPIYDLYEMHNVEMVKRILWAAKAADVKKTVICGSYYTYFERTMPELKLAKWHPYVRSLAEQERVCLAENEPGFSVIVLEFSPIVGVQEGRKPSWFYMVDSFSNMKKEIVYSGGGISLLTRRQAGEAIVGALEGELEGGCYPVGKYNESWSHITEIMRDALNLSDRKMRLIPKFTYTAGGKRLKKVQRRNGYESGFDMVKYTDIHYLNKYLPEETTADLLGITEDDYEAEIQNIVTYSMKLLSHKKKAI